MKIILHLCADIGSDSYPYYCDPDYSVIKVGKETGVENFSTDEPIHGIIANPVCTEFSIARGFHKASDTEKGMEMVNHCLRIVKECNPVWWVLENPAKGKLKTFLGKPHYAYEPWWYGSPWTKKTALWGDFNIPRIQFDKWEYVPKNENLYVRPGRPKPSLAFMHAKAHMKYIDEFEPFQGRILKMKSRIESGHGADAAFRSLCSQYFAEAFKRVNP